MPVNDPASGLPWWVTQGGQANVGGGQATPPGYGGTGWLNYLASMFAPSAAQAAQGSGNLPLMGSMQAVGPNSANARPMYSFSNPPPANGPGPGNVGPVPLDGGHGDGPVNAVANPNLNPTPSPAIADSVTMPPQPPGYLGSTGATGGVPVGSWNQQPQPGPGYLGSTGAGGGDPRGYDASVNAMTGMAPGAVNPGYRPPGITPGRVNPNAPAANPQPVIAAGPAGAPRAAPMGGGPANPRFTTFQYNVPGSGGGQGGRNAPIYTALNLGGLFGGGQPQGQPSQTPRPAVPGPMANGGSWAGTPDFSSLPDDIFDQPDYRNMGDTPDVLAATRKKAAAIAAAASLKQRYG
jgi:hypothetical protein